MNNIWNFLGSYPQIVTVRHQKSNKKSYIFVNGEWKPCGEIKFFVEMQDSANGSLMMQVPDVRAFAEEHREEGYVDWLKWGARVN